MWRSLLPVLLWMASAQAAVTNVRFVGSTPTQAVIAYTAPDSSVCTIEVSESPSFTPLVNDVNPALFSGANLDGRPGNLAGGLARTFVIGKRSSEMASDGRYYSRALQAFTQHFYRIACGSDTATGSFLTANIALGGMYKDPYLRDPNHPGRYAWPTIDYTYPMTAGNGTLTSAANSMAVTFASAENMNAGDYVVLTSGPTAGRQRKVASVGDSRHVTLVQAFSASLAQTAVTWARRTPEKVSAQKIIDPQTGLLMRRLSSPGQVYSPWTMLEAPTTVKPGAGWTNAATSSLAAVDSNVASYAGDANQDWLFVHVPTGISSYQELYAQMDAVTVTLKGSGNGSGEDNNVDLCLTADGATCRSAILTVNLGTCVPWTKVGSQCWVGTEVPLEASWQSPTDAIGSILDPVEMNGATGGILIRKSTTTSNTVSLDYVAVNLIESAPGEEYVYGVQGCSTVMSPQTYNGVTRQGYHCIPGNLQGFGYWVDPASGDSTMISVFQGANTAAYSAPTGVNWDLTDPNSLYAQATISSVPQIAKVTYTGNNLDAGFMLGNSYFQAGTVTALSGNLQTKLASFSSDFAAHEAYWSTGPSVAGIIDGRYFPVHFGAGGSQDQPNYTGIYDLQTNQIIAATSTLSTFPTRWCKMHTAGTQTNAGGWSQISGTAQGGNAACGYGPWQTEVTVALNAPGGSNDHATACPSPMPVQANLRSTTGGVNKCAYVPVAGDIYKPATSCAAENTLRGANGFLGPMQTAQVGDVFTLDSERVQLLAKDPACSDPNAACNWTIFRAVDKSTAAAHVINSELIGFCAQYSLQGTDWDILWDFIDDPNALDTTMTYKKYYPNSHGTGFLGPDPNHLLAIVEAVPNYCRMGSISWGCYAAMTGSVSTSSAQAVSGNYTYTSNVGPAFANLTGPLGDSHPSMNQVSDRRWALDALTYNAWSQSWTQVSGSLWKSTSPALHPKIFSTEAFCASKPAIDVSPGPLTAAAGDNYKFCYGSGCYPGAGATDIYLNCPDETTPTCQASADTGDMCVHDNTPTNSVFTQFGITMTNTDRNGGFMRLFGQPFGRRRDDVFKNLNAIPDGSWAIFRPRWLDGMRSDNMLLKLPPYPPKDSINRSTFIPVAIPTGNPPNGTNNIMVEFGYGPTLQCATRPEACEAVGTALNETTPFYWASETFTGFTGFPGTIVVPAISQRVLYYRLKYRDAGNAVIGTGPTRVQVVL